MEIESDIMPVKIDEEGDEVCPFCGEVIRNYDLDIVDREEGVYRHKCGGWVRYNIIPDYLTDSGSATCPSCGQRADWGWLNEKGPTDAEHATTIYLECPWCGYTREEDWDETRKGCYADDGHAEVYYPDITDPEDAAAEYVKDWEPGVYKVWAWQMGKEDERGSYYLEKTEDGSVYVLDPDDVVVVGEGAYRKKEVE